MLLYPALECGDIGQPWDRKSHIKDVAVLDKIIKKTKW